jgi:hypothetical protein
MNFGFEPPHLRSQKLETMTSRGLPSFAFESRIFLSVAPSVVASVSAMHIRTADRSKASRESPSYQANASAVALGIAS